MLLLLHRCRNSIFKTHLVGSSFFKSPTVVSKAKQLRKQSVWDSVCSLTIRTKCLFLFFSFSQQKKQGLILFIFGLTWRDHLLPRTLKHKLGRSTCGCHKKQDNRGREWWWSPLAHVLYRMYRGTIWSLPQSSDTPSSLHVCLHTVESVTVSSSYFYCINQTPSRSNIGVLCDLLGVEIIFLKQQLQLHSTLMIWEERIVYLFSQWIAFLLFFSRWACYLPLSCYCAADTTPQEHEVGQYFSHWGCNKSKVSHYSSYSETLI